MCKRHAKRRQKNFYHALLSIFRVRDILNSVASYHDQEILKILKKRELRALLLLLLCSAIWGFAFAAQREASRFLQPFTFGAARFYLGAAALLPLVLSRDKKSGREKLSRKDFVAGSIVGCALFLGSTLQQKGVSLTSAGQAGFLTTLYVVFVPVVGIFFGRKTGLKTWLALLLSVPALYLLCMTDEGFHIREGDAWVLLSVIFWTAHILITDHFVLKCDPLHLCVAQFFVCGCLNLVCSLIFEPGNFQNLASAILPVLYVGVMSTGVAYTLQAVGQRDAKPAHAALVMSMESVFSVIAGALILGETLSGRAYIGCALMLTAVILSQFGTTTTQEGLNV